MKAGESHGGEWVAELVREDGGGKGKKNRRGVPGKIKRKGVG